MTDPALPTYAPHPVVYVGHDGHTEVAYDPTVLYYPVNVRVVADRFMTVGVLSLTPTKARELRDNLNAVLADIEVAAIVAAGLVPEVSA